MHVILYSNHCPKCNILKQKLKKARIKFEEINDVDLMISKGFSTVPLLEVDGNAMNFVDAFKWIETNN